MPQGHPGWGEFRHEYYFYLQDTFDARPTDEVLSVRTKSCLFNNIPHTHLRNSIGGLFNIDLYLMNGFIESRIQLMSTLPALLLVAIKMVLKQQ